MALLVDKVMAVMQVLLLPLVVSGVAMLEVELTLKIPVNKNEHLRQY